MVHRTSDKLSFFIDVAGLISKCVTLHNEVASVASLLTTPENACSVVKKEPDILLFDLNVTCHLTRRNNVLYSARTPESNARLIKNGSCQCRVHFQNEPVFPKQLLNGTVVTIICNNEQGDIRFKWFGSFKCFIQGGGGYSEF